MLNSNLIRKAISVAETSPGCGPRDCFRVGAIIFDKKRIYISKTNIIKTHTILSTFTLYPVLHAESHAITCLGLDRCNNKDMLVVRITKPGRLTMAKPCDTCQKVISLSGIRRVWYSDWNGDIQRYD